MKSNIIITGLPGVGKSTFLREIVTGKQLFANQSCQGLITTEMKEDNARVGFKMGWCGYEDSPEITRTIAHKDFKKKKRFPVVSKYGVDISAIRKSVVTSDFLGHCLKTDFYYLDEVGEMQLYCRDFKNLATRFLESEKPSLITLSSVFENPFTKHVRRRKDALFIELTPENRGNIYFVSALMLKIEKAKKYASQTNIWQKTQRSIILLSDSGESREISIRKQSCNCLFFVNNAICSHILAAEEKYPDLIVAKNRF